MSVSAESVRHSRTDRPSGAAISAVRRSVVTDSPTSPEDRSPQAFPRGSRNRYVGYTWQYYDVVLLGIFLSMASGAIVGQLTPLSMTTAVTAFGAVAVALIGHGLFVNGPVDGPDGHRHGRDSGLTVGSRVFPD